MKAEEETVRINKLFCQMANGFKINFHELVLSRFPCRFFRFVRFKTVVPVDALFSQLTSNSAVIAGPEESGLDARFRPRRIRFQKNVSSELCR